VTRLDQGACFEAGPGATRRPIFGVPIVTMEAPTTAVSMDSGSSGRGRSEGLKRGASSRIWTGDRPHGAVDSGPEGQTVAPFHLWHATRVIRCGALKPSGVCHPDRYPRQLLSGRTTRSDKPNTDGTVNGGTLSSSMGLLS
jgi:hypothetical protein